MLLLVWHRYIADSCTGLGRLLFEGLAFVGFLGDGEEREGEEREGEERREVPCESGNGFSFLSKRAVQRSVCGISI